MFDRIKCDRCFVEQTVTAGCYNVTGLPWSGAARPGETIICNECMFTNPWYAGYISGVSTM